MPRGKSQTVRKSPEAGGVTLLRNTIGSAASIVGADLISKISENSQNFGLLSTIERIVDFIAPATMGLILTFIINKDKKTNEANIARGLTLGLTVGLLMTEHYITGSIATLACAFIFSGTKDDVKTQQ